MPGRTKCELLVSFMALRRGHRHAREREHDKAEWGSAWQLPICLLYRSFYVPAQHPFILIPRKPRLSRDARSLDTLPPPHRAWRDAATAAVCLSPACGVDDRSNLWSQLGRSVPRTSLLVGSTTTPWCSVAMMSTGPPFFVATVGTPCAAACAIGKTLQNVAIRAAHGETWQERAAAQQADMGAAAAAMQARG
jgi:hypothetical protein